MTDMFALANVKNVSGGISKIAESDGRWGEMLTPLGASLIRRRWLRRR